MKNLLLLLVLVLLGSVGVFGQSSVLPFSPSYKGKSKTELTFRLDFALGYVPKSGYNALRGRISVNDILFKRLGAYTAFEKRLDSDLFSNTIGGTITVFPFLNIWGGFDMYSLFVLKKDEEFVRKEVGIGIFPYKNFVAHFGYSLTVGPSIAFGYKISLNSR